MNPVPPQQRSQYRAVGERLAEYLLQDQGLLPPVSTLQAIAADMAAGPNEFLLPLKDLVSRPAFRSLVAKAGSGSRALEGHALLQDMQVTFSP